MSIFLWFVCYALPASFAIAATQPQKERKDRVIVKFSAVAVSAVLMTLAGGSLVWQVGHISWGLLAAATLTSFFLLRGFGILYVLASAVQQYCILLAVVMLSAALLPVLATVLTAFLYALAHRFSRKDAAWKLSLLTGWGIFSAYLYFWLQDPVLNIAAHTFFGSILISTYLLDPFRRKRDMSAR